MILKILKYLFKDFYIFTAAYSNNIFPEPLSKTEEEENVKKIVVLVYFVVLKILIYIIRLKGQGYFSIWLI